MAKSTLFRDQLPRNLRRTGSTTSSATPTINTDNVDFYSITALAVDITSFTTNLSGTPTEGQTLWISITGTGTRAITWGASFEASTEFALPTSVGTTRQDFGFVWNTVSSKWRIVASTPSSVSDAGVTRGQILAMANSIILT
jgi:hypothetical protein